MIIHRQEEGMFVREWRPEHPRSTVLFIHGLVSQVCT